MDGAAWPATRRQPGHWARESKLKLILVKFESYRKWWAGAQGYNGMVKRRRFYEGKM